ncbi:MAG: hypothetical protein D3904_11930 [Candidatus Electrothrix sp. EH2]|nr:hypothetical protein [Candidatus Electrothrix sp. EH2]
MPFKTYYYSISILLSLYLSGLPVEASQLPCPNLKGVDDSAIAYTQRGNRCEGFYQSPVSGSLNLVGLLYGMLDSDSCSNKTLRINAPQIGKEQVHIQAIGIPLKTYYRLDAWLEPGEEFIWPLEIIKKMHLRAEDIGLFGQPVSEPEVYVPLTVGRNTTDKPLNLIIRSSVDVDTVLWRSSRMNKRQCGQPEDQWQPIEPDWADRFFSGDAIQLTLNEQKDNFCIEFAAQTAGSATWLKLPLKIQLRD